MTFVFVKYTESLDLFIAAIMISEYIMSYLNYCFNLF